MSEARIHAPAIASAPPDGLTRRYVTPPNPEAMPHPGDVVRVGRLQWHVAGWDTMKPREPDGHLPITLHLERVEQPDGRKKRIIRSNADARQAVLVGCRVLLGREEAP